MKNHANETCRKIYEQYCARVTQSFPAEVDWFEAEGKVDKYFRYFTDFDFDIHGGRKIYKGVPVVIGGKLSADAIERRFPTEERVRIQERVETHIRFGPEREVEALRRANIRLLFGYGLEEK